MSTNTARDQHTEDTDHRQSPAPADDEAPAEPETILRERGEEFAAEHAEAIDWLEGQFPEWTIEVAATTTWAEELRPIWIAHKDGHHPQSELSAAKLHTRLTEYLEREDRRQAMMN